MDEALDKYRALRMQIDCEARLCGRDPGEIQLLCVSKFVPAERMRPLWDAGVRAFAESRVPELETKEATLPGVTWHFIGTLQANKVRRVAKLAALIHSVDRPELLERLDRIAAEERVRPGILLEVNVSGEASKGGVALADFAALAESAARAQNLEWQGLMTMAPEGAAGEELDHIFGTLRALCAEARKTYRLPLPELSMGMSGDYRAAIRNGSTILRVGSAIFGSRPQQQGETL